MAGYLRTNTFLLMLVATRADESLHHLLSSTNILQDSPKHFMEYVEEFLTFFTEKHLCRNSNISVSPFISKLFTLSLKFVEVSGVHPPFHPRVERTLTDKGQKIDMKSVLDKQHVKYLEKIPHRNLLHFEFFSEINLTVRTKNTLVTKAAGFLPFLERTLRKHEIDCYTWSFKIDSYFFGLNLTVHTFSSLNQITKPCQSFVEVDSSVNHIFCGQHSCFSLYLIQQVTVKLEAHVEAHYQFNVSYSVMDIVLRSGSLRDPRLADQNIIYLQIVYILSAKLVLKHSERQLEISTRPDKFVSFLLSVEKMKFVIVSLRRMFLKRCLIFDGPGVRSQMTEAVSVAESSSYSMSTFQCLIHTWTNGSQFIVNYSSKNLHSTLSLYVHRNQPPVSYTFPRKDCNKIPCVFEVGTDDGRSIHVNMTVTKLHYAGVESLTCRYGGLVAGEFYRVEYKHSATLCREHNSRRKVSRSLYSMSSSTTVLLYWYKPYSLIRVTVEVSTTTCAPVLLPSRAYAEHCFEDDQGICQTPCMRRCEEFFDRLIHHTVTQLSYPRRRQVQVLFRGGDECVTFQILPAVQLEHTDLHSRHASCRDGRGQQMVELRPISAHTSEHQTHRFHMKGSLQNCDPHRPTNFFALRGDAIFKTCHGDFSVSTTGTPQFYEAMIETQVFVYHTESWTDITFESIDEKREGEVYTSAFSSHLDSQLLTRAFQQVKKLTRDPLYVVSLELNQEDQTPSIHTRLNSDQVLLYDLSATPTRILNNDAVPAFAPPYLTYEYYIQNWHHFEHFRQPYTRYWARKNYFYPKHPPVIFYPFIIRYDQVRISSCIYVLNITYLFFERLFECFSGDLRWVARFGLK